MSIFEFFARWRRKQRAHQRRIKNNLIFGKVLVIERRCLPRGVVLRHPPRATTQPTYKRGNTLTITATTAANTVALSTVALTDDQLVLIPVSAADAQGVSLNSLPSPLPTVQANTDGDGNDMSAYLVGAFVEADAPAIPAAGFLTGRAPFVAGQQASPVIALTFNPGAANSETYTLDFSPGAATTVTEGTAQTISRSALPATVTLAPLAPANSGTAAANNTGGAAPVQANTGGEGSSGTAGDSQDDQPA